MTHAELVELAVKLLPTRYRCGIVLSEQACCSGEVPDVIGWKGRCRSVVVECKVTRADYLADVSERHLRALLREWVCHYNQARPHSALGPGIPDGGDRFFAPTGRGHALPDGIRIRKKAVLGGLHHEYRLEKLAG